MNRARHVLRLLVGLAYPPTKAKLHRLFHAALAAITVGASVVLWIQGQHWGWNIWNQIEAQSVLVGTFLVRAGAIFRRLDSAVDKLPIPDDDVPGKVLPMQEPTPVTVPLLTVFASLRTALGMVPTNTAAVIPQAPMQEAAPLPSSEAVTENIKPKGTP